MVTDTVLVSISSAKTEKFGDTDVVTTNSKVNKMITSLENLK